MYTVTETKWNDELKRSVPVRTEKHAVGVTLFSKRETVQVMSDIWEEMTSVTYWDTVKNQPVHAYLNNGESVVVDATNEIVRAYVTYITNLEFENQFERIRSQRWKDYSKPVRGSKVRVTRGRNKPGVVTGKEYEVFHVMEKNYSEGYRSSVRPLLGIALDDEKHDVVSAKNGKTYQSFKNVAWVWAHNCEVVGVDDRLAAETAEMKALAKERALSAAKEALNRCTTVAKMVA